MESLKKLALGFGSFLFIFGVVPWLNMFLRTSLLTTDETGGLWLKPAYEAIAVALVVIILIVAALWTLFKLAKTSIATETSNVLSETLTKKLVSKPAEPVDSPSERHEPSPARPKTLESDNSSLLAAELEKLYSLHKTGALTDLEYTQAKAKILEK